MLLSTVVPLDSLVLLCRALRHGLSAGLSLLDVFRQQSLKGPATVRPVAAEITGYLEKGGSLEDALKEHPERFPPLFLALASVGEQTGHLPEVFHELEKYFVLQQQLRRQFLQQIAWPVFQFVAAIGVIAALILILGLIAPGGKGIDMFGVGTGPEGATRFLLIVFAFFAIGFGAYLFVTRTMKQKPAVDLFLLRVPAVGPTLEALVLSRFCLAMRLTLGAGLAPKPALRGSLRATGNALYASRVEAALPALQRGNDFTEMLAQTRLFPEEFLNIVATGEEAGRLPEVMGHQAEYYQEEAARRMKILTALAGWGVYAFVAVMIIWAIFRIYGTYIGILNSFM
jgi:type IV pilus assembly protein PilC